jgi:CDP-diacylglycerol---serine O-phosphatidyltransferase
MKNIKEQLAILRKLNIADFVSLSAIFPTAIGYYFILNGKPNYAIIAVSLAFLLDTLDGYIARKMKINSEFGKQLDSFVDTLNYLVFSAIFTLNFLNFNNILILFCVSIMLASGILRLVRFNLTGFIENNNEQYYIGIIVPFTQLSVVILFLISSLISLKFIYLTPLVLLTVSFLMISTIKFRKPKNYLVWYILILLIICLAVINLNK